jgi:NADH:ubiquinone oxidoreductase subunit H
LSPSSGAEVTRFDFAEGESELVSGFNVEYGGGGFALIFLAEYARILFMRFLFCVLFLGCDLASLFFYIRVTFISFLFIWVRGRALYFPALSFQSPKMETACFPKRRYDLQIHTAPKPKTFTT